MGVRLALGALCAGALATIVALNDSIGALLVPEGPPTDFAPRPWWGPGAPPPTRQPAEEPRPFEVEHDPERWAQLRGRLLSARAALAEQLPLPTDPADPWAYGVPTGFLTDLLQRWADTDWPQTLEKIVNAHPQFKMRVKGLDMHFARVRRRSAKGAPVVPVLFVHGWPGSFMEFWQVLPRVADRLGGNVDLIAPSLPGYGFSAAPARTGLSALHIADILGTLMQQLGHQKWYVQGGDWGSAIGTAMGQIMPKRILGLHLNCVFGGPPPPLGVIHALAPSWFLDGRDAHRALPMKKMAQESGYMHQQATFPDTLAVGLLAAPEALAAWIADKFLRWSDVPLRNTELTALYNAVSAEELIADIMIYWETRSIGSSMRLYWETLQSAESWEAMMARRMPKEVPVAVLDLPAEPFAAPERWSRFQYPGMRRYTRGSAGGHFAALEKPELLAADVAAFIKELL